MNVLSGEAPRGGWVAFRCGCGAAAGPAAGPAGMAYTFRCACGRTAEGRFPGQREAAPCSPG